MHDKIQLQTMQEINLIYIFTAFLFGILHSMEPGHGKSLIATFILGTNTTKVRDALLIGLLASITHTASVYLIGFFGIKVLSSFLTTNKEVFVNFTASIVIFLIGLWLMWDRVIEPLFHEHKHECSAHKILTKNFKFTSILLVGFTAGLIPCSGGLAVFLTVAAVEGFKNILNGFLYVLSYSIGLGSALTLVGLSAIYGQSFIKKVFEKSLANIEKSSGVISAIIIYTLGLVLITANITSYAKNNDKHAHKNHGLIIPQVKH